MTVFNSPTPSNYDESAVAPSPNALVTSIVQSVFPDISKYKVLAGAGYNDGTLPLRVMGGDCRLFFVENAQVTPIKVVGPTVGDPGVTVPASSTSLLTTNAAGNVLPIVASGAAGAVVLFPSSGDDGPLITAALQAAATGVGDGVVVLGPGNFNIATPIIYNGVSNTKLVGSPLTILTGSMAPTAGVANSVIRGAPVLSGVSNTTLNGTPTVGNNSFVVAAIGTIVAGMFLKLTAALSGNLTSVYKVTGVAGTTVTVDRPLLFPWVTGDSVQPLTSVPAGNTIEGNGMKITGTGDNALDWQGFLASRVQDVVCDTSGGSLTSGILMDLGCVNCEFARVRVDGATAGADALNTGIGWSSVERCRLESCRASRIAVAGFGFFDGYSSRVFQSDSYDCKTAAAQAILISSLATAATAQGNTECVFETMSGNDSVNGWSIPSGTRTTVRNAVAKNCSARGFFIGTGTTLTDCIFDKCTVQGGTPTVAGFVVDTAAVRPVITDLTLQGIAGTLPAMTIAAACTVRGLTASGNTTTGNVLNVSTSVQVDLSNIDITMKTAGAAASAIAFLLNGRVNIRSAKFAVGVAGDVCINHAGTEIVELDDVRATNPGAVGGTFGYLAVGATSLLRRKGFIDFSACATPLTVVQTDQGTVTANGAAAVNTAFKDARATGILLLSVATVGGATARTPLTGVTANTQFTITSVGGDTSVYSFKYLD